MINFSHRMNLLSEHFFARLSARLSALKSEGRDVIRLDEGSPDLPPALHIIEALKGAAERPDAHSYQPQRGFPALRQAWAEMYQREFGVSLDAETQVLPLLGSKEGIFHLMMAVLDPGDVALIPDPGYITYTRGTLMAGGEPVYLPLRAEQGFLPDLEAASASIPAATLRRAKVLWLNYPNNPTGAAATPEFFAQAVAFAQRHHLLLCHDAAYSLVTFDGYRSPSLLAVPGAAEVAIEFNTLSKSHNMAGWRSGVAVGHPAVIKAFYRLKTNVDSGHFRPILEATTAALTGDQEWLKGRNAIYRHRRDAALEGLHRIGLEAKTPQASLYVWFAAPPGESAADFASRLLETAYVSLTPGSVFGAGGEGYIRLALVSPVERISEAMQRIRKVI